MTSIFLKKVLPPSIFNALREAVVFRPEHYTNLVQVLPQMVTGLEDVVPHIKGHRYPAPGSVHAVSVPVRMDTDAVYNVLAYPRNSNNMAKNEQTLINATTPALHSPNGTYGDRTYGSTGVYAKPAVTQYDPSGLRSAMNATWGEMDKALDEQGRPDHLHKAEWEGHMDEIHAECERKGIPYVEGRKYSAKYVKSRNYTQVRW